jgi:hypothetical protein
MPSLTRIDKLLRPDYRYLQPEDDCFFLWEYTAGVGFAGSRTNDLILNLKKSPTVRHTPQWKYKLAAIETAAEALREACGPDLLEEATFVPIPPSKACSDPDYDDRLVRILQSSGARDVRQLVVQRESTEAGHTLNYWERPGPNQILAGYEIDEERIEPEPLILVIFDDVLTSGAHFRAMRSLLQARFSDPEPYSLGLFIARTIPPPDTK